MLSARKVISGVSLMLGIVAASVTLQIEHVERFSCVIFALMPGLIGSMAMVGNVHDTSLGWAAAINFMIYFLLCLAAGTLIQVFRAKANLGRSKKPE